MKRKLALVVGVWCCAPAFAGDWSIGVAGGTVLDPSGHGIESGAYTVRTDYWLTPRFAIELGAAQSRQHASNDGVAFHAGVRALDLGVRGEWPLGERLFLTGRAGLGRARVWRNYFTSTSSDPRMVEHVAHAYTDSPYLGIGLGWRLDPHWSLGLEVSRAFGDRAFGTPSGPARHVDDIFAPLDPPLNRHVHDDTLELALDYRF